MLVLLPLLRDVAAQGVVVRVQPREWPFVALLTVVVVPLLLLADQLPVPRRDAPTAAEVAVGRVRQLLP